MHEGDWACAQFLRSYLVYRVLLLVPFFARLQSRSFDPREGASREYFLTMVSWSLPPPTSPGARCTVLNPEKIPVFLASFKLSNSIQRNIYIYTYYTILYYTILYHTILYNIILYYIIFFQICLEKQLVFLSVSMSFADS